MKTAFQGNIRSIRFYPVCLTPEQMMESHFDKPRRLPWVTRLLRFFGLLIALAMLGCGPEYPIVESPDGELAYFTPDQEDSLYKGCCKVCVRGQACGDTCISAAYTCRVGEGCSCDQLDEK